MPKRALPVLVVVALLLVANGTLATSLPLRWSQIGIATDTIAALAACLYAGGLLGALTGGIVMRRLGCQRSFVIFVMAFAVANAALLLPGPGALLGIARITAGSALSGLYLLIESRLNAIATPQLRKRLLLIYMADFYLAQAMGSGFAGLNPDIALVVAIVLILLSECLARSGVFGPRPGADMGKTISPAPVGNHLPSG
jgi:MFS transporter, UMF2 family, putative MFS family transporter protein